MQEQYCCASIGPLASHNGVCIHYDCTHLILRSVSDRSLKVVLPSTNLYEKLTSALENFAKVYTPIQPSFMQCIKEAPAQLANPSRTLNCCLPSPQERTPPVPVLSKTLACCFPSPPQERFSCGREAVGMSENKRHYTPPPCRNNTVAQASARLPRTTGCAFIMIART